MKPARALLFVATLLLASGCLDLNFDPPHLIQSPRLIAIRAEPPESAFGEDVRFEALVLDESGASLTDRPGITLRWTVCASVAEIVRSAGLGFGQDLSDDCGPGGADLVVLETEGLAANEARLPGAVFLRLAAALQAGGGAPGGGGGAVPVDPELLETLSTVLVEVGVPLSVTLEVYDGQTRLIRGFKRFAVVGREDPTTNPPPPRFAIDGVWLSARTGGDPHVCAPEEGAPPAVDAAAELMMTPDPDEDPWIEDYPVFALDGGLQRNQESAYYSWFSTGGAFGADVTRRPERDVSFTAPEAPGVYPVWVVVRDGHLGTSWCEASVTVR